MMEFVYAHFNHLIRLRDLNGLLVCGSAFDEI
jgi:phosphoketolase